MPYQDLFRTATRLQEQQKLLQIIDESVTANVMGLSLMFQMPNWVVLNPNWVDPWLDALCGD
jgi:hypothetical protein